MNDLKFAIRQLARNPGFTVVAVLSLALGIGSATAVFSLLNAIMLRSLPLPNPHELRVVHWTGIDARVRSINGFFETTGNRSIAECVSPDLFEEMRLASKDTADLFAFAPLEDTVVRITEQAMTASGMIVSDNFFTSLQVNPAAGRFFAPNDPASISEVVISHQWWSDHLALDPAVIGRAISINGRTLTIIGVLPRGFPGVKPGSAYAFYVPLQSNSPFFQRAVSVADHWWVRMMARIKPGRNESQLQATLTGVFAPVAESQMKQPAMVIKAGARGLSFDRDAYGTPLLIALGAVGLVLLVTCANLAGLTLARGAARQSELSVRAALGANRTTLIRQSLTENFLIASLGGFLGFLLATGGRTMLSRLLAASTEGLSYDFSTDTRVLIFGIGVVFITALLSGLLPAWRAARIDPLAAIKVNNRGTTQPFRLGRILVVTQVGLSLILLSAAGLYVRTLVNLHRIDPGFETDRLLVFQLNASFAGYEDQKLTAFYERVQSSLAALPGVQNATLSVFPLLDNKSSSGGFTFKERPANPGENLETFRLVVSESFFETLGISMLNGRALSAADDTNAAKVAVVNRAFAKKYLATQEAAGNTVRTWRSEWQLVGICDDTKYQNIKSEAPPTIYLSYRQFPLRFGCYFIVRTAIAPLMLASSVQKAVAAIDPGVPVAHLTTQDLLVQRTIGKETLFAALCAALAALALILACIGLYGLIAFNVERRRGEIAIRMAVGAQPRVVALSIVREGLFLTGLGIVIGLPGVFAMTHFIKAHLYGVGSTDPFILGFSIVAFLAVALCSTLVPAARAARIHPMEALRYE